MLVTRRSANPEAYLQSAHTFFKKALQVASWKAVTDKAEPKQVSFLERLLKKTPVITAAQVEHQYNIKAALVELTYRYPREYAAYKALTNGGSEPLPSYYGVSQDLLLQNHAKKGEDHLALIVDILFQQDKRKFVKGSVILNLIETEAQNNPVSDAL